MGCGIFPENSRMKLLLWHDHVQFAAHARTSLRKWNLTHICMARLWHCGLWLEHCFPGQVDSDMCKGATTSFLFMCYNINTHRPTWFRFEHILLCFLLLDPKLWWRKPWRRCWGLHIQLFKLIWDILAHVSQMALRVRRHGRCWEVFPRRAACWNAGMNPKPGQKHLTNEELKALNGRELTILANEAAVARSLSNSLGKRHYGSAESSAALWQSVAMCRDMAFAKVLALSVAVPRGVLFFIVPFAQPGWHPKTSGVLRALLREWKVCVELLRCVTCLLSVSLPRYHPIPFPTLFGVSCQCNILKKSRRLALFWTCQTSTLAGSLAKLLPCR